MAIRSTGSPANFFGVLANPPSNSSFTVAMWLYMHALPAGFAQICIGLDAGSQYQNLVVDSGGVPRIAGNSGSPGISGSAIPTGAWVHLAWTINATAQVLYVNGAQVATRTATPATAPYLLFLGDAANGCDGKLAGIKVWSAPLSSGEVATEYGAWAPVRTSGLHSWVPAPLSTNLNDLSGNGNHYSIAGGSFSSESDPPHNYTPAGGGIFAGAAATDFTAGGGAPEFVYAGSGGATIGGAAATSFTELFTYAGSGGGTFAGAAATSLSSAALFPYTGSGGATIGGAAATSFTALYTYAGSGGGAFAGAASSSFTALYTYAGAGGGRFAGVATVRFLPDGPIDTEWRGLLLLGVG